MIDTITVPLAKFDLPGFLDAYREYYRSWAGDDTDDVDADKSVSVCERFVDIPMPVYEDRDLIAELTERGWLLFFQLHEPLTDDSVLCIDGSRESSDDFDIGRGGWLRVPGGSPQWNRHPASGVLRWVVGTDAQS